MLGLAGGLVASKLLYRFRHHHHPHGPRGQFRRRFSRAATGEPVVEVDAPRRLASLLAPLELNQRQAEETREAFADVAQALGTGWRSWGGLDEALAAVADERFDRAGAAAALGAVDEQAAKSALDALEHVHNILTPEQREKLSIGVA